MIAFKKKDNDHVLLIENNEVVVDPQKVAEGHFLAVIKYLDEEDKFLEAEIFYHPEEKEVNAFLEAFKVDRFEKFKLTEGLFAPKE